VALLNLAQYIYNGDFACTRKHPRVDFLYLNGQNKGNPEFLDLVYIYIVPFLLKKIHMIVLALTYA
jgi:hypothetical protein